MEVNDYLVIAMFLTFIGLLFTGYPVAWVLGGVGVLFTFVGYYSDLWFDTMTGLDYLTLGMSVNRIFKFMDNWVLVALPMFIFMGLMLDRSGIAEKMMKSMQELFGKVRGGLAVTVTLIGIILAASTGIIGASVVFIPAAIILLIQGKGGLALGYIIYNLCYSSIMEYLVKPRLIGKEMRMNPILVFVGILGGMKLFGILGIIYGPLIITIFLTLAEIYRSEYKESVI